MVRRRRSEIEELRSELEGVRPYLGLAREIHDEVERAVADPTGDLDELAGRDRRVARRRARSTRSSTAFRGAARRRAVGRSSPSLFDDDELRAALAVEHERRRGRAARRTPAAAAVRGRASTTRRARHARRRRPARTSPSGCSARSTCAPPCRAGRRRRPCARRLVLRATGEPGRLLVLDDVFNPADGPVRDRRTTTRRSGATERLEPNTSCASARRPTAAPFEPVVHPGGRLDVETAGGHPSRPAPRRLRDRRPTSTSFVAALHMTGDRRRP